MQEQYDKRGAAEVEAKVRQAIEARVAAEARNSDPLISIEGAVDAGVVLNTSGRG